MRVKWNYIKVSLVLILGCFLLAFASNRNNHRLVKKVSVNFEDESKPYVTRDMVNKLLIQNEDSVTGKPKEKLDLKEMEFRLNEHPMIRKADVYMTVGGEVEVAIIQRQPLARISGNQSFYLDHTGGRMPLSTNFTERVPIITGVGDEHLEEIFRLMTYVNKDVFLQTQVTGIVRQPNEDYRVHIRGLEYTLLLGKVNDLERKFSNYKAFYQKAKKDKTLDKYREINLKYANQVVCKRFDTQNG